MQIQREIYAVFWQAKRIQLAWSKHFKERLVAGWRFPFGLLVYTKNKKYKPICLHKLYEHILPSCSRRGHEGWVCYLIFFRVTFKEMKKVEGFKMFSFPAIGVEAHNPLCTKVLKKVPS